MTDSRKKVLFFINSYAGGAEKMTVNIASFLDKSQYKVIFYIIGKDFGNTVKFIPSDEIINLIHIRSFSFNLIFKMVKILREEKPDIVFSSLMPINWRLAFAAMFFPKIKMIVRANNYLYTQSLLQKIRLFFAYRRVNMLIVQTDEMRLDHINVLSLNFQNVITLENPIDTKSIDSKLVGVKSPFSNETINYVYVGRIVHIKGIDVLIQSFSNLVRKNSNLRLYLVGDTGGDKNQYYSTLLKLIDSLGLRDYVVFLGFQANPYIYIKYADCFVLPSRNEGLPNVVIESLYIGTPVAVTRSIPVIDRIVNHSVNGFLAEVDDIEDLAGAMDKARMLRQVESSYKSASSSDFVKLF